MFKRFFPGILTRVALAGVVLPYGSMVAFGQGRQVLDPGAIESAPLVSGTNSARAPRLQEQPAPAQTPSANKPVRIPAGVAAAPRNMIPNAADPDAVTTMTEQGATGILPDVGIAYPESITLNVPSTVVLNLSCGNAAGSSPARLTVELPAHLDLVRSEPEPDSVNGQQLVYRLPPIESARPMEIRLEVMAREKRAVGVQTRLELVRERAVEMAVTQPVLDVELRGLGEAILGQEVELELAVRNSGDGPARELNIMLDAPRGCVVDGKSLEQLVNAGTLNAGDTVVFPVLVRTNADGTQQFRAVARASGAESAPRELAMSVIRPALEFAVVAPHETWVGSRAWFGFTVTNPTPIVITEAVAVLRIPSLAIQTISQEAEYNQEQQTLTWRIGDLQPGQSAEFQMLATPTETGPHLIVAALESSLTERKELAIDTTALARTQLAVSVSQLELPAPAGVPSTYRVTVTNEGTEAGTGIEIAVQLPRDWTAANSMECEFLNGQVRFQLPTLGPGETRELKFEATGPRSGEFPLRVTARHRNSSSPVVTESTVSLYQTDLRRVAEVTEPRPIR